MNNEEEYKELLKEIRSLKRQISFLEDKISWLMNILLGYRFSPFPPLDKEKFKIRLEEWRKYIEKEGPNIKKETEYIKETFEKCGISSQDATLLYSIKLVDMTSYLASKSLLTYCRHCKGGQLQLLVEDNTVYLTCAKCGRWLWQGLKHEE